jgi:hypothetical protein
MISNLHDFFEVAFGSQENIRNYNIRFKWMDGIFSSGVQCNPTKTNLYIAKDSKFYKQTIHIGKL